MVKEQSKVKVIWVVSTVASAVLVALLLDLFAASFPNNSARDCIFWALFAGIPIGFVFIPGLLNGFACYLFGLAVAHDRFFGDGPPDYQ